MDNMENRSINYSIRASAATLINECDHNYRQQVHEPSWLQHSLRSHRLSLHVHSW